jgi:hypothetical protein
MIKSKNIDWILELVEQGKIDFIGEPKQTKDGWEYKFKILDLSDGK